MPSSESLLSCLQWTLRSVYVCLPMALLGLLFPRGYVSGLFAMQRNGGFEIDVVVDLLAGRNEWVVWAVVEAALVLVILHYLNVFS